MDISKTLHNTKYYDGYEGGGEIEISAPNSNLPVLHIWEGFFSEIFDNPPLDGKGWIGFTRDYNQNEGTFESGDEQVITDLHEYIEDIIHRKEESWELSKTEEVYRLILNWFIAAKELGCKEVLVRMH